MELTGKCKKDFEEWLLDNHKSYLEEWCNFHHPYDNEMVDFFNSMPKPMRFGVYVDFFETVGLEVFTIILKGKHNPCVYDIPKDSQIIGAIKGKDKYFKTREEARVKAIIKANDIHNGKSN